MNKRPGLGHRGACTVVFYGTLATCALVVATAMFPPAGAATHPDRAPAASSPRCSSVTGSGVRAIIDGAAEFYASTLRLPTRRSPQPSRSEPTFPECRHRVVPL